MSFTKQLLDVLRRANYDDRCAKLGARHRDIAAQALESFGKGKDRLMFRLFLRDQAKKEFYL